MTGHSEHTVSEELPAFSFSKRPIVNTVPTSAIPPNINKTFSEASKPPDSPSFNNINYDDQIRAPRMSSATHYTYQPESPRPFTDRNPSQASNSSSKRDISPSQSALSSYDPSKEDHLGNSLRAGPEGLVSGKADTKPDYFPATVDLNQPTRRNSEPVRKKWGISVSVGKMLSLDTRASRERRESNLGYATGSRSSSTVSIEDSSSMQQKLVRAMDNLNANKTSDERTLDSESTHGLSQATGGRIRANAPEKGPAIQQVYTPKKPLCMPAVLRPPQEIDHINEEDLLHDSSPEESTFGETIREFPFQVPAEASSSTHTRAEPTHEHWSPNSASDHCMNCFETFRGLFRPQKRGRHHCRFCGLLYCHNCLHKNRETVQFEILPPASNDKAPARANSGSSNTSSVMSNMSNLSATSSALGDEGPDGVMLDSGARIVIPLFKNLASKSMTLASLSEKFKSCKVCKTCGNNAQRLLYTLNQRSRTKDDIETPYVFIENPYIGETSTSQPHLLYGPKSASTKTGNKAERGSERRPSYNTVPSDWTWSSF